MLKLSRRFLNLLFSLFVVFFISAPLFPAHAQEAFTGSCVGTGAASDVPTIQGLECLVANVLASAVTLIGIVAFVFFLVGGFQILTAGGGNSKGMEQGRNSISFAILGIVVALASILILNVISGITGIKTILQFNTQYLPTETTTQPAAPKVPAF